MIDALGLKERAETGYHGSADPLMPVPRCSQCGTELWAGFLTVHREGKSVWLRFCSVEHMTEHMAKSGVVFTGQAACQAILDHIADWHEEKERLWYEQEFIQDLRVAVG